MPGNLAEMPKALLRPIVEDVLAIISKTIPWDTNIKLSGIGDDAVLLGTIPSARPKAHDRISLLLNVHGLSRMEELEVR